MTDDHAMDALRYMNMPQLRSPTRFERFMKSLTGKYPDSYVQARLEYAIEIERTRYMKAT